MPQDIIQLASGIKLLLMDVDGVLTDGKLYNVPDPSGRMVETKGFDPLAEVKVQYAEYSTMPHSSGARVGCIQTLSLTW